MAVPLTQLVVNGGAGVVLLALGATILLTGRGREPRFLGIFLTVMGLFFVGRYATHVLADPRDAAAINEAATVIHFLATPNLVLFASLSTGIHASFWSPRARIAALYAPFVALLLLRLVEGDPLALPFSTVSWERFLFTGSFVYATVLFALALKRETSPAAIPVRGLLLAGIIAPMVHSLVGLFTEPERWVFLEGLGLARPPLLPASDLVQIPVATLVAIAPALLLARPALAPTRYASFAAISLAALATAVMAIGWHHPGGETDNIRWFVFALLVGYASLRHGYLGRRRVGLAVLEWPLAATAFAVLLATFLATLQLVLPAAFAVGGSLALALLAASLVVALSASPLAAVPGSGAGLSRYQEHREIGRGANGRVVLALDRELHRDVVLKRLPRGERAIAEARAAARVSHPSLVAVHDVAEDDAGPYLVLEYVPTGTLDDKLRTQGVLAASEAKRIGRDLAAGLGAIHDAGLAHGDIKAANVLMRPDGTAALSDFGSARPAPDVEETLQSLAHVPVSGSLAGAAPETLDGAPLDPRADVYALAALLYRCLAGESYIRFPPEASDARDAIRREPPRLPHPRVPPRWEALLARALAKDPARRPADGRALAAELARVEGE